MKLENTQIFVWSAIDVQENAIWVSKGRSRSSYVFLIILKYCENEPEFVVDRGTCCGLSRG